MASARTSDRSIFDPPSFGQFVAGLVFGALFISFSFPLGLMKLARATGWPMVGGVGAATRTEILGAFGASPAQESLTFNNLWSLCLLSVGAYLAALALLSLRHLRFDLFASGVVFLAIGAASLHIITWLIWLFGWTLLILSIALAFIFHVIEVVFVWVFHVLGFIAGVIGGAIEFLIKSGLWPFVLIAIGAVTLYLVIKYFEELQELLITVGITGLIIGLMVGAYFLLYKLYQLIWPFLKPIFEFIGRILAAIFTVAFYVFAVLVVGWIVYGLGAFLMDLFRGAWDSGNGRRGVILGSLAAGTSVALVLMETNLYHVAALYPGYFADVVAHGLHESLPLVDMLLSLLVLAVSIFGILRNLPKLQPEPDLERFQTGFFMVGLGLVIGIVAAAIASQGNASS